MLSVASSFALAQEPVKIPIKNFKLTNVETVTEGRDIHFGKEGETKVRATLQVEGLKTPVVVHFPVGVEAALIEGYLKQKGFLVQFTARLETKTEFFYRSDYRGPLKDNNNPKDLYELSEQDQATIQKLYLQQPDAQLPANDIPMGALLSFVYKAQGAGAPAPGGADVKPGH